MVRVAIVQSQAVTTKLTRMNHFHEMDEDLSEVALVCWGKVLVDSVLGIEPGVPGLISRLEENLSSTTPSVAW